MVVTSVPVPGIVGSVVVSAVMSAVVAIIVTPIGATGKGGRTTSYTQNSAKYSDILFHGEPSFRQHPSGIEAEVPYEHIISILCRCSLFL
jgi:hypothetical protein